MIDVPVSDGGFLVAMQALSARTNTGIPTYISQKQIGRGVFNAVAALFRCTPLCPGQKPHTRF